MRSQKHPPLSKAETANPIEGSDPAATARAPPVGPPVPTPWPPRVPTWVATPRRVYTPPSANYSSPP